MILLDLLYLLVLLFIWPWLLWRAVHTGRYRRDLAAKLVGPAAVPNPAGKPVAWFHGVSVGEIHLLVTVVKAFRQRHPGWLVVVSSTTDTGLAEARARFADLPVIPYPFDFSWACRRAIRAVAPRVIVLAESELWPNFLTAAKRVGVPVVVINGRVSPRTFRRMRRLGGLVRRLLLDRVSCFAMQSEEYAARLRQLGVPADRLRVTGSVKYDGATGDRDTVKGRELALLLPKGRGELHLVAGSTHAPEEEIVLGVFTRLQPRHPNLCLILVPRHPDRFDEVAAILTRLSIPFARRSQLTDPTNAAVLLLDTVGELGAAWGLADLGFTGGSLDGKRGGQSMIEPAGYGVPVVFGPHVWNFRDAADRLVEAGGAMKVADAAGLEEAWEKLIVDADLRARMGTAARELVLAQQGATSRTLEVLDEFSSS